MSVLEDLRAGDLTIELEPPPDNREGGVLVCVWRGRSNDRQPGQILGPYFAKLVSEAKLSSAALEMHFQALEHFNSSTITALIRLIQDARAQKVRLVIVYDANICLTGIMNFSLWSYVARPEDKISAGLPSRAFVQFAKTRALVVPLIFLLGIPISFADPYIARYVPLLIPLVMRALRKVFEKKPAKAAS